MRALFLFLLLASSLGSVAAQHPVRRTILFDLGHHNMGFPERFAGLLRNWLGQHAFSVETVASCFETRTALAQADVLIIRGALHEKDSEWSRSEWPSGSAFSDREISTIRDWVADGGGLLVVCDHMPMAGAVQRLAQSFGVTVADGFVVDSEKINSSGSLDDFETGGWLTFRRKDDSLADHWITNGKSGQERVDN